MYVNLSLNKYETLYITPNNSVCPLSIELGNNITYIHIYN